MLIQVINSNTKVSGEEYDEGAMEMAQVFADLPGLVSKKWLADEATNTYGGVYIWADKKSFEAYVAGEVFAAVKDNPDFENVTSKDYSILNAPTKITRGLQATLLLRHSQ